MSQTKIEWAERVWNPVTGCSKVSEGCQNCYAERMSKRLAGRFGYPKDKPFSVTLHPDRLDEPLRWRKPSRIFVCSMGDLFHDDVPFEFIDQIFYKMARAKRHNFLLLTKRPEQMRRYIETYKTPIATGVFQRDFQHIWLGVTAENQEQADKRIPILLQIPAAVRFVSMEPMLGAINIEEHLWEMYEYMDYDLGHPDQDGRQLINWVILGAESGPKRRYMSALDIHSVVVQCEDSGIPVFVKQIHNTRKELIKDINLFPPELQLRQYPEGA